MKYFTFHLIIFLLTSLLLLTGCQPATPEIDPSIIQPQEIIFEGAEDGIIIEGQVVPAAVYTLAFAGAGLVEEVLVKEGDLVVQGQELARMEGREQALAAVRAAELELLAAQQAQQAVTDSQDANESQAFLALMTTRQSVNDAKSRLNALTGERLENEIAGAQARVVLAEKALDDAIEAYEEYKEEDEDDPTRATYLLRLTEAQRAYDEALRLLDELDGDGYAFNIKQAQDALQSAEDQLRLAEERYSEVSQGPDSGELEISDSRVNAAEAGLAAAQANQDNLVLKAPAAGTVVKITVKTGELLVPGQPFGVLADLSEWYVETVDLTEIDVVKTDEGQVVQVTVDALPGVPVSGAVESISSTFQNIRGDITYVARIKLENVDANLRWGMTVLVTFSQSD
jgi:multidrug resistance efflux pump